MIIIGITGTLGAGKGTIVDFLIREKGFVHFSVRSYLTTEISKRNLPVNRDNMVLVANELREKHSPSFIIEQLYNDALKTGKNCIIESIRTPGEVYALKQTGAFFLFAVDAPVKVRYDRIIKRKSETDFVSFDTFVENEKREMTSNNPNKQNISKCIALADYFFMNDESIEKLEQKTDAVIRNIITN